MRTRRYRDPSTSVSTRTSSEEFPLAESIAPALLTVSVNSTSLRITAFTEMWLNSKGASIATNSGLLRMAISPYLDGAGICCRACGHQALFHGRETMDVNLRILVD